jgi:sulfopropanediol 3-dehydrogenase
MDGRHGCIQNSFEEGVLMARYIKSATKERGHDLEAVRAAVTEIIEDVRTRGEDAVRDHSRRLDAWNPGSFLVDQDARRRAERELPESLKEDIRFAAAQVRNFARIQLENVKDLEVETLPGVRLGQRTIPVASVGSYTPGGRYPLIASALMTIVTPRVAGVDRIVAMSPPRSREGMHPPTIYAMTLAEADAIYCLGGVQALAAMAFGAVEGLDPVDMIVGAGNAFVAEAKRQLFGTVGIDLLAGPTEILIIADDTADPEVVAADLLGQAEHDPRSPAALVTTSEDVASRVAELVEKLLETWPTAEIAGPAWRDNGVIVLVDSDEEAVEVSDDFGPEHLEVQTRDPDWYLERLHNYGSLFLGEESTVVYSDKAIGTNHVLPTMGAARYTGGLWVGKFLKTVTYQRLSRSGSVEIAEPAGRISAAELMFGHELTAKIRIERYGRTK